MEQSQTNLPKRFKVKINSSPTVYTIIDDGEGGWRVEWTTASDYGTAGYVIYTDTMVRELMDSGQWVQYTDPLDPVEEAFGFKVGDKVKVVKQQCIWDYYKEFAEKHHITGFKTGAIPPNGQMGEVVLIAQHMTDSLKTVFAVRTDERHCYLLSREAIEKTVETNGFDDKGEPLLFTREDVKPGMRVEFKNGDLFVAIPNLQDGQAMTDGPIALCRFAPEEGYMNIDFTVDEEDNHWDIAKVFAAPNLNYAYGLKGFKTGLLWQREEPGLAKKKARTLELQGELARAAQNVVEWTDRMERIKEELRAI